MSELCEPLLVAVILVVVVTMWSWPELKRGLGSAAYIWIVGHDNVKSLCRDS